MANTIIRSAQVSDLDALCNLYFEFHEYHAQRLPAYLVSLGQPSTKDIDDLQKKIQSILLNPDATILVAEISGKVIGFAEVYKRHPDVNNIAVVPKSFAYLQSLFITQAFWRLGIGRQLRQTTELWAQDHEVAELRMDVWDIPQGPLDFYIKAGYHTLRRSLVKDL